MKPERGPILGPTSIRQDVLGIAPFVREQVRAAPSGSDHWLRQFQTTSGDRCYSHRCCSS